MFKLFCLLVLASGWVLAAASLHVVRTPANLTTVSILPKDHLTFEDTYVDTRPWTMQDVPAHRPLVRRVIAANKPEVLAHIVDARSSRDVPTQLSEALSKHRDKPATVTRAPSVVNAAVAQFHQAKAQATHAAKLVAETR